MQWTEQDDREFEKVFGNLTEADRFSPDEQKVTLSYRAYAGIIADAEKHKQIAFKFQKYFRGMICVGLALLFGYAIILVNLLW